MTFELTATGEPFAFRSSAERGTLKEAREEAAKVACRHLGELVVATKLTMIYETS